MVITLNDHIEMRADLCGGKPCIAGTRIRVWDIHVWHDLRGQSPAEIVASFPQLRLADVHAALAYYLDHREQIERQMQDLKDLVQRLEQQQGATRFTLLRDGLARESGDNGATLPSR